MENGFIIDVRNNSDTIEEIDLFSSRPYDDQITIRELENGFNYHQLHEIAMNKGFKGRKIMTTFTDQLMMALVKYPKSENKLYLFNHSLTKDEILIDGKDFFLRLFCPPKSDFIFQLK